MKSAWIISSAALLAIWAFPCQAAQDSTQFTVHITLLNDSAAYDAGLCRSSARIGAFGEAVTVICTSGESVVFSGNTTNLPWSSARDGEYRFMMLAPSASDSLTGIGSYAGVGTLTTWRLVSLSDRDYLELMIGW